jgi:CheY-like chemotaxis protein
MSRVLLVDDSPHAQRIGERILTEEGFEVVTVSNADSALVRIEDVDPDVVIADVVMPGRTGYEICQYLKMNPRRRHVRVILTAGVLEAIDEARAQQVEADASIKKPFEASALVNTVRPLAEAAARERKAGGGDQGSAVGGSRGASSIAPFVAVIDEEQVRAAVTVALDASMETIVNELARRVVSALQSSQSAGSLPAERPLAPKAPEPVAQLAAAAPAEPKPSKPAPSTKTAEPGPQARRVNPLRIRTSILGLEAGGSEPEGPSSETRPPASGPQP